MDFRTPEDLLGQARNFRFKPGGVGILIAGFLVLITVATSFYSIGTDEKGVVLLLGRFVRVTGPGLHIKMPMGIERVFIERVERVFKEEFGFRTEQAGVRTQYRSGNYTDESNMLTGDLNALVVTWIVQYRILDPVKFNFKLRNPVDTIRDMSEASMRRLVGDYSVDEVLTTKRDEINNAAKSDLQGILDSYDSGVRIDTVKLQDVTPPPRVQPAFNEVNQAKQQKEQVISEALQQYNKMIPQAKGGAEKTVLEAQGYAVDRVNAAKGNADRFNAVLTEYRKSPEVTRRRLYLESMEKVLTRAREKYVMDPSEQGGVIPFLDLRREKVAS